MNLTERENALASVKDAYLGVCELNLGQLSKGQEWDIRVGANTHWYDGDPLILIPLHKDTPTQHEGRMLISMPPA